jgi:competence protein ComEC
LPTEDFRLCYLAAGAWLSAWLLVNGDQLHYAVATSVAFAAVAAGVWWRGWRAAVAGALLCACVSGLSTSWQLSAAHVSEVRHLAQNRAQVQVELKVATDPDSYPGQFGTQYSLRAHIARVVGPNGAWRLHQPVQVWADESWRELAVGDVVTATGRLDLQDNVWWPVVLKAQGGPEGSTTSSLGWRAANNFRQALHASVAALPAEPAAVLPSLVTGDDGAITPGLTADFRAAGLSHLLVVSGTNLTILLVFLISAARWLGVKGHWLRLVAFAGILIFVALARPEPSVLRAAVMGSIGVLALQQGGPRRGARTLGGAVLVLILLEPELAVSWGFALSVAATLGIVVWSGPWSVLLEKWLPAWLAQALAVTIAAQIAVMPLLVSLSGQVSVVSVVANLLAAPLVAPATIGGLLLGVTSLVLPSAVIALLCWLPGGFVFGIVEIAHVAAQLPGATVEWGHPLSAVVVSAGAALLMPWVLARRRWTIALLVTLLYIVWVGVPRPWWPPDTWQLAMCDVGQGDALVLNLGHGSAVLVDTGPEGGGVVRCLQELEVSSVPLVVLTHFHADHVGGLPDIVQQWAPTQVFTSPVSDPAEQAQAVYQLLDEQQIPYQAVHGGELATLGALRLQFVSPMLPEVSTSFADLEANNSSVVVLVELSGISVLLTGDIEAETQRQLHARYGDQDVDILKVPHHGSVNQDSDWLSSLSPKVALISVGSGNNYGQPSATLLRQLSASGAQIWRTDTHGDIAVNVQNDVWQIRSERR